MTQLFYINLKSFIWYLWLDIWYKINNYQTVVSVTHKLIIGSIFIFNLYVNEGYIYLFDIIIYPLIENNILESLNDSGYVFMCTGGPSSSGGSGGNPGGIPGGPGIPGSGHLPPVNDYERYRGRRQHDDNFNTADGRWWGFVRPEWDYSFRDQFGFVRCPEWYHDQSFLYPSRDGERVYIEYGLEYTYSNRGNEQSCRIVYPDGNYRVFGGKPSDKNNLCTFIANHQARMQREYPGNIRPWVEERSSRSIIPPKYVKDYYGVDPFNKVRKN